MIPLSDRIVIICLNTKNIKFSIPQIYTPTTLTGNEKEFYMILYSQLKTTLRITKNIVKDDRYAKVENMRCQYIVGEYGLGNRSDPDKRLIQFDRVQNLTNAVRSMQS